MSVTIHDFEERLRFSEEARLDSFWIEVYRKAFPNLVNCMACPGNHQGQRQGVDRLLYLGNNQVLRVDEKARSRNYDDVLLEFISVDFPAPYKPGWIEKDLAIDYLAYGFVQSRQCYLFPWQMLRKAWLENHERWFSTCGQVEAKNDGYSTWSLAIPTPWLFSAVNRAMRIELPPKNISAET